jgi:glutamate-ammonia-ligase adenylyltransferase
MDERLTQLEAKLGVGGLASRLEAAFARAADEERASRLAAGVLEGAAADPDLPRAWAGHPDSVARVLAALCGAAPFFAPVLTRHPDWLSRLAGEDFATARSVGEYDRLLADFLARDRGEVRQALRRFKYYELARITVRDLSDDLVPESQAGETLAELSHLADALLSRALASAAAVQVASLGPARWTGPGEEDVPLGFSVLGLGKLGSEELNYSSDVDLVYVFESPPFAEGVGGGPGGLAPIEYFTRLAQEFGRLVTDSTSEGFLYRVDVDLRPEGSQGPLVVSSNMLADYYDAWAATWEKAAFMKARPVAGDHALGWRVIRGVDPMIYRSSMDFAGVAAIKEMKEKISQAKERGAQTFNVKIGSGGIRDIEFVAQALQLLHGGRIPQVRGRSTQQALVALTQVGVLPQTECDDLLAGYRFLRRTENRLQMEAERQTHSLPPDRLALRRLARAMGFRGDDPLTAFEERLAAHRERIKHSFAALFDEEERERVLKLFERNAPSLLANPASRRMIEHLAAQLGRAIDATSSPERAMNNLDRFIQGVGRRRFYYELLLDRPELAPRLAALFSDSEYLSSYLATHPRLIEPIFSDPNVLLLSRRELRENLAEIRRDLAREERRDGAELGLDALRLFHNRQLVNVGLLDLGGKISPVEAERGLTELAEVCVEGALEVARGEMGRRASHPRAGAQAGEFLVVGMGKLASRELTYGSDLDVIFLYDVEGGDDVALLEAQEYFVRLAQKLIWALQTRTSEGVCYLIAARLRPSGNQGMLVSSLESFEQYHAGAAQVWERQALLRARPVGGGERLAQAFEDLRRRILRRPAPADLGREIHRIRLRMESELAQETTHRRDFKTGRGGLLDVESVVQFLQLRHGAEHEELLAVDDMATHLARLRALDLLSAEHARVLLEGWQFLQLLSSRLRIVENRSISDLDEERGDLDTLAHRLGYASPQRAGGARRTLLEDYRHHTGAIRAVYLEVLNVGECRGNGG